jgi:hypothetical protein
LPRRSAQKAILFAGGGGDTFRHGTAHLALNTRHLREPFRWINRWRIAPADWVVVSLGMRC